MRLLIPTLLLAIIVGACSRKPPAHQLVALDGGSIRIPQTTVADGRVHFFTF